MQLSLIPSSRFDDVIKHLRGSFFAHEPLNEAVGLCSNGGGHKELEAHSMQTMQDEMSVMAEDPETGEIVGVALNGILRLGDLETAIDNLKNLEDERFRKIMGLLYGLNMTADLFQKYNVDKLFECRILSVDENYRGRGIAKQLLVKSIETARENGFKVIKEDATGKFSQKIADSCGFETLLTITYDDLEPQYWMPVPAPHTVLKIMAKELIQ